MRQRTLVSGITLVVLLVILVAMGWWGYRAATQPVTGSSDNPEECSEDERQVQRFIERSDVQVSVFNAGGVSGLAGRTLDRLEAAGFVPGNAGNAPEGERVRRAVVWTTEPDDTSARLVARVMGGGTKVRVVEQDLGPGVDVLVGDRFQRLAAKAPQRLELAEPVEQCIEVD